MGKFTKGALAEIVKSYEKFNIEEVVPDSWPDYFRSFFSQKKFRQKTVSEFIAKIQRILVALESISTDAIIPQEYITKLETIISEHQDEQFIWPCSSVKRALREHQFALQIEAEDAERKSRTYSAMALLSSKSSVIPLDEKKHGERRAVSLQLEQIDKDTALQSVTTQREITYKLLPAKQEAPKQDGIQFSLMTSEATYQVSTYNYRLRQVDNVRFVTTSDYAFIAISEKRPLVSMSGFSNFTVYAVNADLYRWEYKSNNAENISRVQFKHAPEGVDFIWSLTLLPGDENLMVVTSEKYKQEKDLIIHCIPSGETFLCAKFPNGISNIYPIISNGFMYTNTRGYLAYASFKSGATLFDKLPIINFGTVLGIHYQSALKQLVVLFKNDQHDVNFVAFCKSGEEKYEVHKLFPGNLSGSLSVEDRYVVICSEKRKGNESRNFIDIIDGMTRETVARVDYDLDHFPGNDQSNKKLFLSSATNHSVFFTCVERLRRGDKAEGADCLYRKDFELTIR